MTYQPTRPPNDIDSIPPYLALEIIKLREAINNEDYREVITPQWTTATTDPAIGNGTITGSYVRRGDMVTLSVRIVMGSTTTFGAAGQDWRIAPPANLALPAVGYWSGTARAQDAGTTFNVGACFIDDGNDYVTMWNDGNGSPWRVDQPFTWANTDELHVTIDYRVED